MNNAQEKEKFVEKINLFFFHLVFMIMLYQKNVQLSTAKSKGR